VSIKEAMNQYFALRKEAADEGLDFLFKTPFDEEIGSAIYVGEVDSEDYISWRPVEKNEFYDFQPMEEDLGCKIHPSVKAYFNSYWFADLDGFFKDHYIKLESVLPNAYIQSYSSRLREYKNNHNHTLDHIPLGMEGNGLIVVVDNRDGSVKLEDFERNAFEAISESIEQFIVELPLRR